MSITLYGVGSSRSFRCLWALEEAKLDYQFISMEMGSDGDNGMRSDAYLKLNTQGKIPTLAHDDFILSESAAILNYINSLTEHSFIPTEPKVRARYDELSYFILTELEQPLWNNGKHRFAIPEEHRIPAMLDTANWEFKKALDALESLVNFNDFALSKSFTFADILLAHTLDWAERFKFEVSAEGLAYRDRLYNRDAAKRALKKIA